jgi:hypothetical protein
MHASRSSKISVVILCALVALLGPAAARAADPTPH